VYRNEGEISTADDLAGKKIGERAYGGMAGVWARGLLYHEYGVEQSSVKWVVKDEEHIGEYHNPPNVVFDKGANLGEMLAAGELSAAIGLVNFEAPNVKPLIPDARQAQAAWYQKTGAFPINNTVVIRNDVLAADAAIAPAVYAAFQGAKKAYVERLKVNGPQARDEEADARYMELTGDPLPTGIG